MRVSLITCRLSRPMTLFPLGISGGGRSHSRPGWNISESGGPTKDCENSIAGGRGEEMEGEEAVKAALGVMYEAAHETGANLSFGSDFRNPWADSSRDVPIMSGLLETRTALSKIREVAHGVFHEKQPCSSLMIPPYKWWGIPKSSGPTAPPLPTSGCEFESLASNGRVAPVYICTPPSWSPRSGTLSLQPKIISRLFALDGIECSLSSEYLAVNRQLAAGALAIVAMGDTDGERVAMELATTEGKHAVFIEADGVAEVDGHMDDVSRVRLPWCENGKEESIRESEGWAKLVRCIKASCYKSCKRRRPQVYISCNSANSEAAAREGISSRHVGTRWADPAQIRADLENRKGRSVWLDTDHSGFLARQGLFAAKAAAISHSDIVLLCVSNEYVSSQILRAESLHALDHLGKRAIVCAVGTADTTNGGEKWEESDFGLVVRGLPVVDFRGCSSEAVFIEKMDEVNGIVHEMALDVLEEAMAHLKDARSDLEVARRQSADAKRLVRDAHARHRAGMCAMGEAGGVKEAEERLRQCEMQKRGAERLVEIATKSETEARERVGAGRTIGPGMSAVDDKRRIKVRLSGMQSRGLVCEEGSVVSLRIECVPSGCFKGRTKGREVGAEGEAAWGEETARFECALGSILRIRVMTVPGKRGAKDGGAAKGRKGGNGGGGALLGECTVSMRDAGDNPEGEKTSFCGWHAIRSSQHGAAGEVMIRIETAEIVKRRAQLVYREDKTIQTDKVPIDTRDVKMGEGPLPRRKGWGEGWFDQMDPGAPVAAQPLFSGPFGWRRSMAGGRLTTPRGLRPAENMPSTALQQQQQAMWAVVNAPVGGAGSKLAVGAGGWDTVYRAMKQGGIADKAKGGAVVPPGRRAGMGSDKGAERGTGDYALSPPKLRKYFQFVDGDEDGEESGNEAGGAEGKSQARGLGAGNGAGGKQEVQEDEKWGDHWSKVNKAKKLLMGNLLAQEAAKEGANVDRAQAWLKT